MGLTLLAAQHLGFLCPQVSCSRRERVWIVTPWDRAEARKTHCGFQRTLSKFSTCLLICPHWDCEAPSLHRLSHTEAHVHSLMPMSHTESHTRARFHMLPHASACPVYCAYLHPSASSPAGLVCSCNMQHNLTHSCPLPCVHASIHPGKPKGVPTYDSMFHISPHAITSTYHGILTGSLQAPLTCPGFQQQEQEHPGPDRSR